jgi:hypothetical protein
VPSLSNRVVKPGAEGLALSPPHDQVTERPSICRVSDAKTTTCLLLWHRFILGEIWLYNLLQPDQCWDIWYPPPYLGVVSNVPTTNCVKCSLACSSEGTFGTIHSPVGSKTFRSAGLLSSAGKSVKRSRYALKRCPFCRDFIHRLQGPARGQRPPPPAPRQRYSPSAPRPILPTLLRSRQLRR